MSGPKVDIASIRSQEMEKLAAAREARKNLMDKIQSSIRLASAPFGTDIGTIMQDEALRPTCERVLKSCNECCRELNSMSGLVRSGNELLDVGALNEKLQHLMDNFNKSIKEDLDMVTQLTKSSRTYQQLETNRQQLAQARKKNIIMLTSAPDDETEVTQKDVDELAAGFESEFKEFMESGSLTSRQKNSMLLINQDLGEIIQSDMPAERKVKRIRRLFGDFRKMSEKIKNEAEEMKLLYDEYVKECFDTSAPVKELSDFGSDKDIETEIANVKRAAGNNLSKEYIKRQIGEVMSRHGYDVVRSDMLTEAEQSGQVLYGVDNDTAIDVFVSDENQVTMRVVGVGFDSEISESENESLYQQQCAFCSMHPQITAELAMRGVILSTKKHLPPDRKFNKKIQTRSKSDSRTTSRAKKELKKTELKTMHKE